MLGERALSEAVCSSSTCFCFGSGFFVSSQKFEYGRTFPCTEILLLGLLFIYLCGYK